MRTVEKFDHRVVLLRVGMDSGEGGIQGPLLKNGQFDYLPITDDSSKNPRKYGNTKGRYGTLLINYWPESMRNRYRGTSIHHDPEFETFTYGDPTRPKQSLRRLKPGDLLVFYAGLQSWSAALGFHGDPHLYLIGYFVVEIAGRFEDLNSHYGPKTVRAVFANSPHIHESGDRAKRLNLVKGSHRSKLFQKAYLLSEYAKDRNGRRIKVLRKSLEGYFGRFSSRNYLQRSPPRWVKPEFAERAHNYVLGLA